MTVTQSIQRLTDRQNLTLEHITDSFERLMEGELSDAQIAGLLIGLRVKGETAEEITAIAQVIHRKALTIKPAVQLLVDTCGTGGDYSSTFNISTTASFVVAGAGIPVAKHGNRSVSSRSGSADVLEALGANLEISPQCTQSLIEKLGVGFLFAPQFHPAMRHASKVRKELGIRTIMNCLGPLLNPAGASHQIVGIYDPDLTETIAQVLVNLGVERGLVVHGSGLDEITTTGPTKITEFTCEQINNYEIAPEDFNLTRASGESLQCQSPQGSADLVRSVLDGRSGPARDIVILNAGAAIYISGEAPTIAEGIEAARESIDSGQAATKLERFIAASKGEA